MDSQVLATKFKLHTSLVCAEESGFEPDIVCPL